MNPEIQAYNQAQSPDDQATCDLLARQIDLALPEAENKVWHRHPVWFLDGNPIVGYHRLKKDVRLLFWSGQSFGEPGLTDEGTFMAAEAHYASEADVDTEALARWLAKSRDIQWDYEHIRQTRGELQKRTDF